jgi:hypothetical protein
MCLSTVLIRNGESGPRHGRPDGNSLRTRCCTGGILRRRRISRYGKSMTIEENGRTDTSSVARVFLIEQHLLGLIVELKCSHAWHCIVGASSDFYRPVLHS